jgi:hypothetical protein
MKKIISIVFFTFFITINVLSQDFIANAEKAYSVKDSIARSDIYFLEEFFVDSVNIGVQGKNKIEIFKYRNDLMEDYFVKIKFYDVHKYLQNTYVFEGCDFSLSPDVDDYNNDGYNDFVYQSGMAARGANFINTLFIYEPQDDELIHIKNSDNYPNLHYNKHLDCLNALAFSGGVCQYFLKIEKDSLQKLASIETWGDTITIYNSENKVIEERENTFSNFPYFRNWHPLEEEKEEEETSLSTPKI